MKKIILVFAFLLTMIINAQNKRFVYEYKFVSDSTKKDESKTESMFLDVAKKGSKFYSRDRYISDSLIEVQSKNKSRDFSKIKFGMISYVIEKSYPDYKVLFFNRLDMDEYKVSDERKLSWKIYRIKRKLVNLIHKKQLQILREEYGRLGLFQIFRFRMDHINFTAYRV
ncbi:GLPGLI family protein [Chryseobacterium ginsenosidimutans]|nr:GLPGLI family protein [Chryseobacterium ginsenosidimutans]